MEQNILKENVSCYWITLISTSNYLCKNVKILDDPPPSFQHGWHLPFTIWSFDTAD